MSNGHPITSLNTDIESEDKTALTNQSSSHKNMISIPKRLHFIDGIRGILALDVLLFHFLGWNQPEDLNRIARLISKPFQLGHVAVNVFIVISGYSLMLPVIKSKDKSIRDGFSGYIYRRIRRIFPVYYSALLVSIVVLAVIRRINQDGSSIEIDKDLSWDSVLSHLLLIHTWIKGLSGTINPALWSVATEWHIYFLFPTILIPVWARFGGIGLLIASIAIGLSPLFLMPSSSEIIKNCPWYVVLFAVGMIAAVETEKPFYHSLRYDIFIALIGAAGVFVFLYLKSRDRSANVTETLPEIQLLKDCACGITSACLLIYCYRSSKRKEFGGKSIILAALESACVVWLGSFSYSLYAIHFAVLKVFEQLAHTMRLSSSHTFYFKAIVGIPLAIAIAYYFSLIFEIPFLKSSSKAKQVKPVSTHNQSPHQFI